MKTKRDWKVEYTIWIEGTSSQLGLKFKFVDVVKAQHKFQYTKQNTKYFQTYARNKNTINRCTIANTGYKTFKTLNTIYLLLLLLIENILWNLLL